MTSDASTSLPHRPPPADNPRFGEVTALLHDAAQGDASVVDALFEHLYAELKNLARQVRVGRAGQTLSTTALVHEAYLKLLPSAGLDWKGRAHFLGVAARAMRQVLVDAARTRTRAKRGGGDEWAVTFDEQNHAAPVRAEELVALDEALERLARLDERQARIVEYRYFAGMTGAEVAALLGVSEPTVQRDWRAARAWLRYELARMQATEGTHGA